MSIVLFAPWFVGMFLLVDISSLGKNVITSASSSKKNPMEMKSSSSEGKTLVESYDKSVDPLRIVCRSRDSLGIITVTFVTYLAVEGVAAAS